jgi:membrane protease YdiL (CAAX protease family)
VVAVVGSALLFAALHLPVERMLPAAAFGVALGFAAVATDSAIPGMVMHASNNLVAAVVLPAVPALSAAVAAHPLRIISLSLVLTAAGAALLARSPDTRSM